MTPSASLGRVALYRQKFVEYLNSLASVDQLTTVLRMSLLFDIGIHPSFTVRGLVILLLVALGLLFDRVLKSWLLWAALFVSITIHLATAQVVFSARLLNLSWTLAVLMALRSADPLGMLRTNARLLVGLVFAQGFIWKVFIEQDFINGSLMRYSLLFCSSFRGSMVQLGLVTPELHLANSALMQRIKAMNGGLVEAFPVDETGLITAAAIGITCWTLLIEGFSAATALCPPRWRLARLRHFALLTFCWTVYSVVPVFVYAGIFCTMGLAMTERDQGRLRLVYVGSFLAMLQFEFGADLPIVVEMLRGFSGP